MARIAVIGGGIAGLTGAYRLACEGHAVELLEASETLGGLGQTFEHGGARLDKYYHVMLDSDAYLVPLVREVGLASRIRWAETGMGIIHQSRLYPFNTAVDLLRFGAVPFHQRVRTGMGALYITAVKKKALDLDEVLAVPWLRGLFGDAVYETIWDPLLAAKFGERRGDVPAYWVWNTLNREKNGSQEVKGTVLGGYGAITDALAEGLRARGGVVRLRTPIRRVDSDEEGATVHLEVATEAYDAVVMTPPLPVLRRLLAPELAAELSCGEVAFQGVCNVVLALRRRLSPWYWTAVVDSELPFQGIVETTHVVPLEDTGGRHLLYLMNYCGPGSEPYDRPDALQLEQAIAGLCRLYPGFRRDDVEAGFVFRAPHVEPVWTRGTLARRPRPRLGTSRVFLATTVQAYPMVTAWNTSVKLATDAVNALRGAVR